MANNSIYNMGFLTIDRLIQWARSFWEGRDPYIIIGEKKPGVIMATFINTEDQENRFEEEKIVAHIHTVEAVEEKTEKATAPS